MAFSDTWSSLWGDAWGSSGTVESPNGGSTGLELEIYRYNNYKGPKAGILPFRLGPTALNELKEVGGGSFTISRDDPKVVADPTLLDGRNLCKVVIDKRVVGAFLLGDRKSAIVGEGERAKIGWELGGSGLKQWFDDARVEAYGGTKVSSGSTRYFNFSSEQGSWYNAGSWITPIAFGTVGSKSVYDIPEKWPEAAKSAQWIWGTSRLSTMPAGDVYFRYTITIAVAGRYAIYSAVDDGYVLYVDGTQIAKSDDKSSAFMQASRVEVDLTAGTHVIGYQAYNWDDGSGNGRGPAALAMAIALITGPDAETLVGTSQTAGWKALPYPTQAPGWSPGEILGDLMAEAGARGVVFPSILTKTFTDTLDSNGVAWPAAMYGEWSFGVGDSLLSVVKKMEEAAVDIWIDPDTLNLNMVPTRGVDRTIYKTSGSTVTASPIEFKIGKHVREANTQSKAKIKNDLLMKTLDGWQKTADSASVGKYGRLESAIDTGVPTALANTIAGIIFAQRATEEEGATYDLIFNEYIPFVDFNIGDWVLAPNELGQSVPRRVMSISVAESDAGRVLYTIEFDTIFRTNEDRLNKIADKLGGGGVGGGLVNVSGSTPGVGQPSTIPPFSTPPVLTPNTPTGLTATTNQGYWTPDGITAATRLVLTWNPVTQNTDTTATTPAYYEVRGYRNGNPNFIDFGQNTTTSLDAKAFTPGDSWVFQVRAINPDGTPSAWSTTLGVTTNAPNTPLPAPTTPAGTTSSFGLVVIPWDGKLGGATPAPQFRYIYAEVSTAATGQPWVKKGNVLTTAGQVSIPGETTGTTRWVRLTAIDGVGLASSPSAAVSVVVTGVTSGNLDPAITDAIAAAKAAADAAREQSNMLGDPSFELNTAEYWTLGTGVTNVTTAPRTGTRHLRVAATSTPHEGFRYNRPIPCQPGDTFYFRVYIDPQGAIVTDGLVLSILSGATTTLSTATNIEGSGDLAGTGYLMVTGQWTVPAGINYFAPRVWIDDTSNANVYFIDDVRLLKMSSGVDLVAGSVTADIIAAGAVVAEKIQAGAIAADKIQANAIDASKLAADSVTSNAIAAGAIDADMIQAGAVRVDHLAPNVGNTLNIAGNVTIAATQSAIAGVQGSVDATQADLEDMQQYYSFGPTGAVISKPGSIFATRIDNDSIDMLENGNVISYWNSGTMYVNQLVGEKVTLGNHQIEKFGTGTVVRSLG